MTVTLASDKLLFHLGSLHPALTAVLRDLLPLWPKDTLRITSIYRTPGEDAALGASGIHTTTPHRALDASITALGSTVEERWRRARAVATQLNALWVYDPNRPTLKVCVAQPHGTGPHLHVQVHPRTRRRADE